MIKRVALVTSLLLVVGLPANASSFKDGTVALTFEAKSIAKGVTEGGNSRGPALALLKDDTVLLGGGRSGGEILTWNKAKTALRSLGTFIPANRRQDDSRFALTILLSYLKALHRQSC